MSGIITEKCSQEKLYYLLVFGAKLVLRHISRAKQFGFCISCASYCILLYCCILFAYMEDKEWPVQHCRGQRTVEGVGSCFLVLSSSNFCRLTVPRILLSESVRLTKVMITSTYICKLHVSNLYYKIAQSHFWLWLAGSRLSSDAELGVSNGCQ